VRFSGQEFAVILPETPREGACAIAERLRKACRERQLRPPAVTVSIGAATLAKEGQEAISLIQTADRALTEAKRSGRNRVVHDAALAKAASTSAAPSSPSRRTV